MGTLKEEANQYESQITKNISELDVINTDLDVLEREGTDNEGKPFKFKVIIVDGNEYRVPPSILGSLKEVLTKNPNLKTFSVSKSGEGMKTRYTLIPIN